MTIFLRGAVVALLAVAASGCGAMMVTGAVVGISVAAGTIVTKTAVGAGTLAVKGTGAVVRGTARAVSGRDDEDKDG